MLYRSLFFPPNNQQIREGLQKDNSSFHYACKRIPPNSLWFVNTVEWVKGEGGLLWAGLWLLFNLVCCVFLFIVSARSEFWIPLELKLYVSHEVDSNVVKQSNFCACM